MHCIHCGGKLSDDSKYCKNCGSSTDDKAQKRKIKLPASIDEKRIVRKWSWAGFTLGWAYLLGMRAGWWALLFLILNYIPYVGVIPMIYLGIEGRKIAWEKRNWEDFDEYIDVQRKWDIWGIIIFVILAGLIILGVYSE